MSSPAIKQNSIPAPHECGAVVIPFPVLRGETAIRAEGSMKDFVLFPVDQIKGLPTNAKPSPFSPYSSILRSIEQYGAWSAVLIHKDTHALIAGRSIVLAYRELAKKDPEKWKSILVKLMPCKPGSPEAEFLANDTDLQHKRHNKFEENQILWRQHQLWEQLHPETAQGKGRSKAQKEIFSFCRQEAAWQDCDVRTIAIKVECAAKLNPEVRDEIRGLHDAEPLDPNDGGETLEFVQSRASKFETTQTEQRELIKVPLEQQPAIWNLYLHPSEAKTTHMAINNIKDAVKVFNMDAQIGKYGELPNRLFPIICADFASPEGLACIEEDSVQLFLMDIPYNELNLIPSIFDTCFPKLDKERGQIAIMYGNHRLAFYTIVGPSVEKYGLISRDEIQIINPPGSASSAANPEKMIRCDKPVAVFSVNRAYFPCNDVIMSAGPEKDLDQWQQPVPDFEELIQRLSDPNDLVVDPFAGTGTTLIAGLKTGRRVWGCDKDLMMTEKTKTHFVECGLVSPTAKEAELTS
ncbi:DNA methyltransferase [Telmatobacter sp. DSM 110680]|uniref:DNA methyltransferase n=1 Tax=Telmatobacter sp. DSM 110680 TaxID=3036704 RepID=A0AAU7DJS0_9BACT